MIDHANTWWDAIANAIEEGYVAINLQGEVVAWNQCALKILRISAHQIIDPTYWKSHPLSILLEERQHFSDREIEVYNKTWLKINGRHLVTDTDSGYILTFTDITKWID